jgi:hypothetical protein
VSPILRAIVPSSVVVVHVMKWYVNAALTASPDRANFTRYK